MHVLLMFLSQWVNFLRRLSLQEKKNLMTARVIMLMKSSASPDMLPVSLYNKKRLAIRQLNRPSFATTLSIPSYDMGKNFGARVYQHTLVIFKRESRKSVGNLSAEYGMAKSTISTICFVIIYIKERLLKLCKFTCTLYKR